MAIKIRPYAKGSGFEVDISVRLPDGRTHRERKKSPVTSRSGTKRWAEAREADILARGLLPKKKQEAPTLESFASEFQENYAKLQNKPAEQRAKEVAFRVHLVPAFGRKRLDEITAREIDKFAGEKLGAGLDPKSVNNYLSILSKALKIAVEWKYIDSAPRIRLLRTTIPAFDFLDFGEAARLVEAADPQWRVMILMALRTGMRVGELRALRWRDVDLIAGKVHVRETMSKEECGPPKSGKAREVPLGQDICNALRDHLVLGDYVFCDREGTRLRETAIRRPLERAARKAGIRLISWHVLRHTFASHLAMKGAPLSAIQELLGHSTILMTMRYAHLSPATRRDVVALLDLEK